MDERDVAIEKQIFGALVAGESFREIVEADQAHRHVVERDGELFGVAVGEKLLVGVLVVIERFLEAILAVKNVADVVFETGQTALVAHFGEDFLGFGGESEGAVVIANHDVGMNGGGDGAADAFLIFGLLEKCFGFVVEGDGGLTYSPRSERTWALMRLLWARSSSRQRMLAM